MKKKRLLVFHPTIAPYRIDFFNDLYQSFETRICLEYWNLKDQTFDYQKIYDQFRFKPFYLPEGSIWALCKSVIKQIRKFQPDIVITCEYGIITLITLMTRIFCRKKFDLVVMTDDSYDMVAGGNDFTSRHKKARQILAPYVSNFVVVSPLVRDWYQEKYQKGIWMPIIVDDEKAQDNYERLLPLSREFSRRYGLEEKKVLLSVSRLVDLKNLHRVIDAFALSKTDATLVIVGDGPERESLETHAKKVNKEIIFTGRFDGDELYAWYNLANVFILASYQEPFGAVTNEALLAGCRVVISNKCGSSCLVDDSNGELVDPMDVDGIAAAIDSQMSIARVPDMLAPRDSLMSIKYKKCMNDFIKEINV